MTQKATSRARQPLRLMKGSMALLALAAIGAYLWVKGLFKAAPTEHELRQAAKAKQRRIRRELRGLAPESTSPKVRR